MTTRTKRFSAIGGLFILGVSLMLTYAYAFNGDIPYQRPTGPCDAGVTATLSGNINATVSLVGYARFDLVEISPASEIYPWGDFIVRDLRHDGNDPVLGDYTLSTSPTVVRSRIQSKVPFAAFPAKSTLRFPATLVLENNPGVVYRSVGEIVIENEDLNHWPHNNDVYHQVGSTRFESASDPTGEGVTLSDALVTVTAQ